MSDNLQMAVNQYCQRHDSAVRGYLDQYSQKNAKYEKMKCEVGIPQVLTFDQLHNAYIRGSYGYAAINAICNKVWELHPYMVEESEDNKHKIDTPLEKEIKKFARRTKS